jgi:rRNA-processing protein EBP2
MEDKAQDSEEEEVDERDKLSNQNMTNSKAVMVVASDLIKARSHLPWPETFTIISSKPLPFGGADNDGNPLDIHDDLKREVAFYNTALDAVLQARIKCEECNIPFSRPADFFAEMIKSDGAWTILVLAFLTILMIGF